jgi:hypothetical protein
MSKKKPRTLHEPGLLESNRIQWFGCMTGARRETAHQTIVNEATRNSDLSSTNGRAPAEASARNAPSEFELVLWRRVHSAAGSLLEPEKSPCRVGGASPWAHNSFKQRSKKPRRTPAPGLKLSKPRWVPRTSVINVAQPWTCSCGEVATRPRKGRLVPL